MITLTVHDLCWIRGAADDPEDQCAHGTVDFRIHDSIFVSKGDGELAVSGAALFLLRTLTLDHTPQEPVTGHNRLFPHCAFTVFPDKGRFAFYLPGCDGGIDVSVVHDASGVRVAAGDSAQTVSEHDYRQAVLSFADVIDAFYRRCTPKVSVPDDWERDGWTAFWEEWRQRVKAARSGPPSTQT